MKSSGLLQLHVLVLDDVEASRHAASDMVTTLGHRVSSCAGGEAALTWLRAHRCDLVLMDLLLPTGPALDLCRRIRQASAERWLPVIVSSSFLGEADVIDAHASGADECLQRPVSQALLDAKLRHYGRILALQSRLSTLAQRQRDIQDNILDAVLTIDESEHIVEANLAACRTFSDGTPEGLVGSELRFATGQDLKSLRGTPKPALRRVGGSRFPAEVSDSRWTEAGAARTTLVLRDLTERLRNERMRDEFLATVSHELRTPLTSVLGAVSLLASGAAGALPERAMPLAHAAMRNGERLSKLIDDILDLTKLEGDRMLMNLRVQSLPALLRDAIGANQAYADRSGVRLALSLGTTADGPLQRADVRVDGDRFLQVMANLLSNGIKHSPRGACVTVSLQDAKRGFMVRVADEGPGVDPAFRAQLFEKFSQADTSDRRAIGGTGLGLYIARLMIERMGGRIAVAPPGEGGASFDVWLPSATLAKEAALPPTDFGTLATTTDTDRAA